MTIDLHATARRVSREHFGGALHPRIRWGRKRKLRRTPAAFQCATYNPDLDEITIHPLFDDPSVPPCVVEYLIYHEMLHIVRGGPHNAAFRDADKSHPDYWRVDKWLGEHIHALAWKIGRR